MSDSKYCKKRTIDYMKKNQRNKKNVSVYNLPIEGICAFTQLVKKQNLKLLKRIADDKLIHDDEKEEFINKYSKVNYFTPEVAKLYKEEIQQYI